MKFSKVLVQSAISITMLNNDYCYGVEPFETTVRLHKYLIVVGALKNALLLQPWKARNALLRRKLRIVSNVPVLLSGLRYS